MTHEVPAGLLLLVSAATLRLALTDAMLRYVKPGMRPWLVAAGLLLGVLGVVALLRPATVPPADAEPHAHDDHDHGPGHVPRSAWLLVLPVLGIFLVAPASLGSYAASRQDARPSAPRSGFPALPATVDGAIPLSLNEYTLRTLFDSEESLRDERVRLLGFVTPGEQPGEFVLTRFAIACCAADGIALKVRVRGVRGAIPPNDTWVRVLGTWVPPDRTPDGRVIESRLPVVAWEGMQVVPEPRQPYES